MSTDQRGGGRRPPPGSEVVDARTWVEYLARSGHAAMGVVYGTIGVLATMTAFGFSGGRIVGPTSAIDTLRSQPLGQVIAWCIVIGLAGYVVWRGVQAIRDPEHKGNDAKGLLIRAGFAVSGLSYAALAFFTAWELLGGRPSGGDDAGARESTATLLQLSWGPWLVALVGLVFVGIGGFLFHRAWSLRFVRDWKSHEMDAEAHVWATRVSRFGIMARAVSFGLIGWFLIQAALTADPGRAEGLAGAIQSFASGPAGTTWLAAIGLGFVCYAVYCMVNARFRRINP